MENIFVAIVIIFLLLFGALTMSSAYMSAQQTIIEAQQQSDTRANDIARTAVSLAQMRILNLGSVIEVILRNNGSLKLADFAHWDVFTEYYDNSVTPALHAERLPYDATASAANAWSVGGIYLDREQSIREEYEPGIFNPSEEMVLYLDASPAVGVGQSAQVTVVTENGVPESIMGRRNAPPFLTLNTGLKVALQSSAALTPEMLLVQDADNNPSELTYTVITVPTQGALTPETTFTQQQINEREVVYTHSGTAADSFEVSLSDGIDVIGPFTVAISLNDPPVLAANLGLTLPTGATATITSSLLQATDSDDSSDKLTYTITQFPANGALSLGSTFTQSDIDSNRLTYTHTGTDADLFNFIVSDGYDVIGAYSFVITLVD